MAVEFPGVKCVGVDVAPSFLHYPKDNLVFEIYNFPRQGKPSAAHRWYPVPIPRVPGFSADDGSYDVVHARGVVLQVCQPVELRRVSAVGVDHPTSRRTLC